MVSEKDLGKIKKKAFRGAGVLILRNLIGQPISFLGFVFLSALLKRWELGIFWAVSEVVGFLGYFSDIGLAAALIQKKEKPGLKEIRATFTVQQILVVLAIIVSVLLLPWLEQKFHFGGSAVWLFYALLGGFFLASLKTIPSVLLEREMAFEKIALVDLSEQITFTTLAVILAWQGFGLYSWAAAVIGRAIVGVTLMYLFAPWPLGFNFHLKAIKDLLHFGVPFQTNSLLALAKDRVMNIVLWGILGSDGIGILGWSQRWAQFPLRFFMDQVIRVTFPAYSRLQTRRQWLRRALAKSISLLAFLAFPLLAGLALVMPWVVQLWPKYHKWQVALVPFWFYIVNAGFGLVTTPITNAFNAIGKVHWTFYLMVFWTSLTWLLVPFLAKFWGVNGAAFGLMLVSATSVGVWYWAHRSLGLSIIAVLWRPFLATASMMAIILLLMTSLPPTLVNLLLIIVIGGSLYLSLAWLLARDELFWLYSSLRQTLKNET